MKDERQQPPPWFIVHHSAFNIQRFSVGQTGAEIDGAVRPEGVRHAALVHHFALEGVAHLEDPVKLS